MGLLHVLRGMQNGPRGQPPSASTTGMSPLTMAVLGYLAFKGIKHLSSSNQTEGDTGSNSTGSLGGLLGGGLGGLLSGGLVACSPAAMEGKPFPVALAHCFSNSSEVDKVIRRCRG